MRILRITGRDDDMLIIRGVNLYPSQMEAILLSIKGIAPHYQLIVERQGTLDSLTVEVEAAPDFDGKRDQLATDVQNHVKSLIGVSCKVDVVPTGHLPRFEGKAVRVCDRRVH